MSGWMTQTIYDVPSVLTKSAICLNDKGAIVNVGAQLYGSYRRALSDPANSTFSQIEKTIKKYKTHRDAGKFDAKFIRESVETD